MPFTPVLPDLDLFKVARPSEKPVRLEDSQLPDGSKMIGPDGLLIPPARNFSMVVNAATRVYSYRWDEAMRDNFVNARAMRRDAFLLGLFEERILPTINREWSLEVDDDRDPEQQYVKDKLSKIIRATHDFDAFKRALLDAVWYGRAGAQWSFAKNEEVDDLWGIHRWDPLHGDSCQATFDGVPAILMDTMTTGWYAQHGAKFGPPGSADLEPTDRGGTALVLRRPYWRDRFAIHRHIIQKADYFEGELAGSVQGFGLRGQVYWQYVVRTDALTWMLAYMQAVGQMDLLVFNYPAGNFAAQQQQEMNAQKIIGKAAIACPRDPKGNWPAVEQIPMNAAGLTALQKLVADYFDRHIERLIVGQSMSSGADKGTGLGGTGRADFARATKDEILVHDCTRLDATMTRDLVRVLKKYNFPWAKFPVRFKSVMPDLKAQEKVMSGKVLISVGIPVKADELREAAGYSRPEPGDDVVGAPPQAGPPGGAPGQPSPGGAGPGQPPPPAWMGAPSGPPGAGAPPGGPLMASRGKNPARYGLHGHEDFQNKIHENLAEDVPHLVYADWLEENGMPAHADFIRRTVSDPRRWVFSTASRGYADKPFGTHGFAESPDQHHVDLASQLHVGPELETGGRTRLIWSRGPMSPKEAEDWYTKLNQEGAVFGGHGGDPANHVSPRRPNRPLNPADTDEFGLPTQAARYMGFPSGGNTYIPSFGGSDYKPNRDTVGLTRHASPRTPTAYGHKFGCAYINLEAEAAFRVLQAAHAVHPEDLAPDGRELEAHVTVRFGFHDGVKPEQLAAKIGKFGPVSLRLGRCAFFSNAEHDVLYFAVESEDLKRLNRILGALPNTQTHKDYKPHATVAYLKRGLGPKYAARFTPLNLDFTTDVVYFSDPQKNKTAVSTTGEYNRAIAIQSQNPEDVPVYPYRRPELPMRYEERPLHDLLEINAHLNQQVEALRRPVPYLRPNRYADAPPPGVTQMPEEDPESFLPQNPAPRSPLTQEPPTPIASDTTSDVPVAPQDASGQPMNLPDPNPQNPDPQQQQQPSPTDSQPFETFEMDYTSPENFVQSIGLAVGFHGENENQQMERAHAAMEMAQNIPDRVRNLLGQGKTKAVVSYKSINDVASAWTAATGKPPESEYGLPVGFYDPKTGTIHTDGDDPVGTTAHEIGHAIDRSVGHYPLSVTDEWKSVWRRELASKTLNDYSAEDEFEGFAEFCRLVYAEKDGKRAAQQHFPGCFKFFKQWGLV